MLPHRIERSSLAAQGGSAETERAVELALAWLAAHQAPTGEWSAAGFDGWCEGEPTDPRGATSRGNPAYDPGVTGLALCAFLGAGHSPQIVGGRAKAVERGLAYLIGIQDDDGCFGPKTSQHYVYNHAAAALAMVEAYAQTGDAIYRRSAQRAIDFVQAARNPFFAWRYGIKPGDNDTSVTCWMLTVLGTAEEVNRRATRRELAAPFRVDPDAFDGGRAWLAKMTATTGRVGYITPGTGAARPTERVDEFPLDRTESLTAAASAVRMMLGESPTQSHVVEQGLGLLLERRPAWNRSDGSIDMCYWLYGTAAMRYAGGFYWQQWNDALRKALVPSQRRDSDVCDVLGSWDPVDPWGRDGGRVYATALCALCLESYYRVVPSPWTLFQDAAPGK